MAFTYVSRTSAPSPTRRSSDLGLESHGSLLDHATVVGNTLTAFAADGDQVFTVTLTGAGAWTFTLINPIDQVGSANVSATVTSREPTPPSALSGLIQANEFDDE